mmetsp:Transcript_70540/g.103395  ORF Transcript_70540/g.103395 Transcript_70540/m.103395 type:complete len:98 (+) Transcript_70540:1716-2009(+)
MATIRNNPHWICLRQNTLHCNRENFCARDTSCTKRAQKQHTHKTHTKGQNTISHTAQKKHKKSTRDKHYTTKDVLHKTSNKRLCVEARTRVSFQKKK